MIFVICMIKKQKNHINQINHNENYLLGGWAREWTNVNDKYKSTLLIRLHIRE